MNRARTILRPAYTASSAELLGDFHPLLAQLGSAEGLVTLSSAAATLRRPMVRNPETLAQFLEAYHGEILLPLELPIIYSAYQHASRHETRELIALDQQVGRQRLLQHFASASRRVGRCQLRRLRPLRDERVVQRYLQAVERGDAQGWHTLVYGVTLAMYSLPVRQGLVNYARKTLEGFVHACAVSLKLSETDCLALVDQLSADWPRTLDRILARRNISTSGD